MTDANERLYRAWGQVSHLNAVVNTPELREAYNANLPLVTQYYAELAQDQALFGKFKQLRNSKEFESLSSARKKIIENELRDFRLGGAELPPEKKERFLHIQEELSALGSRFNDNLLDATNNFALHVENADELSGIPDDVLQTAREIAEKDGVVRLEIYPACAFISTADAVCGQPGAARKNVSGLFHPRQRNWNE